ncbi:Fic family protein [Tahibacter soli]|uniref:Protein adenylyltransferase n=1 Tax=Tahibacter soli TaxID=2983605 RepID=A0A9X4BHH8_9GAMM|nr:Fic family protein [Tahibacter soli]MDC8014175.1 Fic family protein [Tahibacter soli]
MPRSTGRFVPGALGGSRYRAFIPDALPPDPPLDLMSTDLIVRKERADQALGRLDGITLLLPDPTLFLYQYVRREALLSSQIEGTQSSLSDLLLYEIDEAPGVPIDDVEEVSNYVAALRHGLRRLREDGFPISLRLLREIHERLLRGGRGENKRPGEFRREQVWIGGATPALANFVPPPPDALDECLAAFERFLHAGTDIASPLIKAGLAHVQFETIHPFSDGNGRLGRLLIAILLCADGVLQEPSLYLSLYFKRHRAEYYERLNAVRTDGDWEGWLAFFLAGIAETATQAVETARRLVALLEADRKRIALLGRRAGSASAVFDVLTRQVLSTVPQLEKSLHLSTPAIRDAIASLADLGIVNELTGQRRNRVFAYQAYLEILNEGTTPL